LDGQTWALKANSLTSPLTVTVTVTVKVMGQFENLWISRACPLLVVVKQLKPLTALSGTVYRLARSMSDHTPVLSNMFEEWNEKSVVLHISFVSFVINYWWLNAWFNSYSVGPSRLRGMCGWFDSRFHSNANGQFADPSLV